jgi:hypothetical protein
MKKLLVTVTAVAMLIMSVAAVSAAEVIDEDAAIISNMDAETFLESRLERLDQALEEGLINQEQYDLMVEHMTENAEEGVFGKGPNGYLNNESCVLGEDGNLQLFRNENSGLRNGQGNGAARRSADGSRTGFGGGQGKGFGVNR